MTPADSEKSSSTITSKEIGCPCGSFAPSPSNPLSGAALLLIGLYQKTRFLRQPSCRFYPSCSQYMAESIKRFGFFKGLLLGSLRLLKCHPLHEGGIDEVPKVI
jgi:uncharacterized protein